ncbi:MAG TPA: S16 family serine protease [Acidimicrobiia bacterium]|nr:S16 family serine protease [Acidimicrobiia bacterium]
MRPTPVQSGHSYPPQPEAAPREKSASWPLYLIGALFVIGVLSVVAWNVEIPYLAYSAGPVSDAADSVVAEEVALYPPDGELLMLTVVSQDVNVFEALIAGVDPRIDLVKKQAVRQEGESDEDYRNRVLQQMDDSNFRSIAVALDYLGYEMVPIEVVVNDFVGEVPAADVLELGDTIKAVNGNEIGTVDDFAPALEGYAVGDVVTMDVVRNGEVVTVDVVLAEKDDAPGEAMIGVYLGELTEPPFPIAIEAGDVGGPSAGMMHAIAIIDSLTEGELTQGRVIAGTGTIQLDGTVGTIGGIRQKVVAAEAAGADYILVPQGNYESALTAERDHIEIVPVATLGEAITFLETLEAA